MLRRIRLKHVLAVLGFACLIVPPLLILYFVYLFDWNSTRDRVGEAASEKAARTIVIEGDIRPDWGWPFSRLSIGRITVANVEGGSEPLMLELERLSLAVNLRALLRGDVEFTEVALEKPQLLLERNEDGDANWAFPDNPTGALALAPLPDQRTEFPIIGRLAIDNGRIIYRDPTSGTELDIRAATVRGEADDGDQRIEFAGDGVIQGRPFRFDLVGAGVRKLRESAAPYPISASIVSEDIVASITGTVTDPIAMKGLDVALTLRGDDAANLFPLTGIALLPTPPFDVAGRLHFGDGVWNFRNFSGHMGDSDLAGELSWDQRCKRPLLEANFTSSKLDLADLGGFIGAREERDEQDDRRILPDVPLDVSRLSAMDADVQLRGIKVVTTKLPIDDFYARFHLDDRVLKVDPIRFGTGKGNVVLRLDLDGRDEPVQITSKLELRRVPIKSLFEGAADTVGQPNIAQGYLGGTAALSGTGKSLRDMLGSADGTLGIGMESGQLSHLFIELIGLDVAESVGFLLSGDDAVPIRCVIGDFAIEHGLMHTRTLVLDTDDTIVTGTGTINLEDESLELVLEPRPKDFSPLSARTPLAIGGTMKDPAFTVKPAGLVARAAAAVALGVLFPPAALVAFLEPGPGEDSQCKPLLSAMANHSADSKELRQLMQKNPQSAVSDGARD